MANRAAVLHMGGMGRKHSDVIDLPVPLDAALRDKFYMFFREVSIVNPDITPSRLAARLLEQFLDDDLLIEKPEVMN